MPHDDPALHEPERYVRPGEPGHNAAGGEVVWERWQKKRTFVRALEGTYGELVRELFTQPRLSFQGLEVEGRAAALRQDGHPSRLGQGGAIDRMPPQHLLAARR